MNVMQQLLMMNIESLLKDFAAYRPFHKSDTVINMRIPYEILDEIKKIAAAQGVPYQSLISSVLFSLVNADESKSGGTAAQPPRMAEPKAEDSAASGLEKPYQNP